MRRIKKILSLILAAVICTALCAFSFPTANITADVSSEHIYSYITAEKLLREYSENMEAVKYRYNGQYLLMSGRFENASGNTFRIMDKDYGSVVCEAANGVSLNLSAYTFNESMIAVYGRCYFSPFEPDTIKMTDVVKVMPLPVITSDNILFTIDGSSLDLTTSVKKTIKDTEITYNISPAMAAAERGIKENGLGNLEGYCYNLNELPGGSGDPEMLFVAWFSSGGLLDHSFMSSRPRDVEKAVIDNISGNSSTFSSYRRTSQNGIRYDYFIGKYSSLTDSKGYHAEYIFRTYNDGMVIFLYIYREPRHISDVMFTINTAG